MTGLVVLDAAELAGTASLRVAGQRLYINFRDPPESGLLDRLSRMKPALAVLNLTSAPEAAALKVLAGCDFPVVLDLDSGAELPGPVAGLPVRWIIRLTADQVYRLDALVNTALDAAAEPVLVLDPDADLAGDDRLFAWDFVTYRMLEEEAHRLPHAHLAYYRALSDHLADASAPAPDPAAVLDPQIDGPRGYSDADRRRAMLGDLADVAHGGLAGHLRAGLRGLTPRAKAATDAPMKRVLLIGAYGGEHIGDGAILGGVLFRIHARHGATSAILMTQRPGHTRHLMPMLETPVDVEVREYTYANIAQALKQVDGIVYAGGPLTDLPKQLVRHLFTVARARGLPFVMEGVGPSTFVRWPSYVTARRFTCMAERITIRTSSDASRRLVRGCDLEIGQDPAFDYLATRPAGLTRLRPQEPAQIDELLAGGNGGRLIGVNIRPIGHAYTPAVPGRDKAAYTNEVQDRFEREFAAGLAAFAARSQTPPVFVFFPMNAIQFGMSDLRSAWRIARHLPESVDFRVWQADASLDGVVALIRRLDAVVSMRFHATIFALSQNVPVLGVDYRIGKRDKVAAVLADAGQEENCCRIDQLTADWLEGKLGEVLAPKAS